MNYYLYQLFQFQSDTVKRERSIAAKSTRCHIYGITVPPNGAVEQIVLEFSPIQGKYFLGSPFIEPFEVLESGPDRLLIRLSLIVNIDLVRKLASFGSDVRVIKPESLSDTMRHFFEAALEHFR